MAPAQEFTTLASLTPDPKNRRKHTTRNIGMLVDALKNVGAARSIVIDESGQVLAGNGVVAAAEEAGITGLRVVDVDGDTIVAVRRRGLTEAQKRDLAIYDNRVGELAEWNVEQLLADQKAGLGLSAFFTDKELDAVLGSHSSEGRTDPDAIPKERATDIVVGDLFELGPHRILCGDATKAEDAAKVLGTAKPILMVTDPPYGVEYDPTWRAKAGINRNAEKMGKVLNDHEADWSEAWRLFPGDIAYVWHAALKGPIVQASLERTRFAVRAQIIWAKDRLVLSRGDYHWQHEPCFYGVREGKKGQRSRDRRQTTVWRIGTPETWATDKEPPPETTTVWEIPARDDGGHGHGTQKPVECMARPMRNHIAPEVYEPFSGSGTTIIAGQMLGRRVYAIELNPVYVQLAIDRWEAFSGRKAKKVGDAPRLMRKKRRA